MALEGGVASDDMQVQDSIDTQVQEQQSATDNDQVGEEAITQTCPWTGCFRFTDLSAELREMVILSTLPDEPIPLNSFKTPAIARVSRQVRQETLPLFFSACTFQATLAADLEYRFHIRGGWRQSRPMTKRARLSSIERAGRLGLKRLTRELVKDAGDATLFRNLRFTLFRHDSLEEVRDEENGGDRLQKQGVYAESMALATLALHMDRTRDLVSYVDEGDWYPKKNPAVGTHHRGWGPLTTAFQAPDVDAAMDGMARVAKEIASREDFKGFDLSDVENIAKGCRRIRK